MSPWGQHIFVRASELVKCLGSVEDKLTGMTRGKGCMMGCDELRVSDRRIQTWRMEEWSYVTDIGHREFVPHFAHRIHSELLGLRPINERRCHKITPSLTGWVQTSPAHYSPCSLSKSERFLSTSGRSALSTWLRHWLCRLLRVTVKLTNVTREQISGGNSTYEIIIRMICFYFPTRSREVVKKQSLS